MINRTKTDAADASPLPLSRWIDVAGTCDEGHVVGEQIAYVRAMIQTMRTRVSPKLDIYVITPFRDVAKVARVEFAHVGLRESDVGTVHTFQGKEADVVILILGLDARNGGASLFASKRPNLLNVAVTRAKHRCYVVGAIGLWGNAGSFTLARERLGIVAPAEFEAELRSIPSSSHAPELIGR